MLLFLDIDDVLCISDRFGGLDAIDAAYAVRRGFRQVDDYEPLWRQLFDAGAVEQLRAMHAEYRFEVVISSAWARRLDRDAMQLIFRATGLTSLADALHGTLWTTRDLVFDGGSRAEAIRGWLHAHPHHADSWVVLDDELSGTGLAAWPPSDHAFTVLCAADEGLTAAKGIELGAAFERRRSREHVSPEAADLRYRDRLALHSVIAETLLADPSLLELGRQNLGRWVSVVGWTPSRRRWQQLLDAGAEVCARALQDEGAEGDALRKASPLLPEILTSYGGSLESLSIASRSRTLSEF